jgi:hypothetical protein
MHITVTMKVPTDAISDESSGTDLSETAYDELNEVLTDLGYEDITVSRGF